MSEQSTHSGYELLSSPWLHAGAREAWEEVLVHGQRRVYKKREMIIRPEEALDNLYYLRSGRIRTTAADRDGHQKILWFINDGCLFGETPLFNQKPCAYCFQAETNCEVYLFSRAVFYAEILPRHPAAVENLLRLMARKIHVLSIQVEDFVFIKPLSRVAKLIYLLQHSSQAEELSKRNAPLPATQEDIAEILGLHRVTVNNAIRELKKEGVLESNAHTIIIRNVEKLREIALLDRESPEL